MLLAQFLGIVHEIKPLFLHSPAPLGFDRHQHLPPPLIALGHYSGNSGAIVQSYGNRSILVWIAENFDVRLAAHLKGQCRSPLFWNDEAAEPATLHFESVTATVF